MKATEYEMIVTNKYTGEKMKAKLVVEVLPGYLGTQVDDVAIGEIQNNFLWETFDFDVHKLGMIDVEEDAPVNIYSDVEVVT